MSYITKSVTIIITLAVCATPSPFEYSYNPYIKQYTRNVTLKQGTLQGVVVETRVNRDSHPVEIYRGIPYAAPPVGGLRFMPTAEAPSWFGIKMAETFGPVCPQKFPDEANMSRVAREEFLRLREYLQNQSEDCLYLNIYAPYLDEVDTNSPKHPVMVYLHGESFEWNSGNPYDGSVLAAYGKVIVVTLNFRLGILGFLKAGTEEGSHSNFGLVDQTAALIWIRNNIAAFGGDPNSVSVFGHGTGAVCASLLMISPMMIYGDRRLFHRAILMSGTALADWALASNPNEVTFDVANSLNCQIYDNFEACLRKKRLDEIMAAATVQHEYRTRFGPIVDSVVVPSDPKKSMTEYPDLFRRYELMYGVTEIESIDLLGPVALAQGMLEKERDQELRKYLRNRCEKRPELCLVRTLAEYAKKDFDLNGDHFTGDEPDKASISRDILLDILSDARTVAPLLQTGRYHAALNLQSYFYVFTHKTHSKEYIRDKSYNGEELPYVFGVPLGGPKFHFVDTYTEEEKLFSEIVMTYFCNFAHTGNPNVPTRDVYRAMGSNYWSQFDDEWLEFDTTEERYIQLDIPTKMGHHYRQKEMRYWNEILPKIAQGQDLPQAHPTPRTPLLLYQPRNSTRRPPPRLFLDAQPKRYPSGSKSTEPVFGTKKLFGPERPDNILQQTYGTVLDSPPKEVKQSSASTTTSVVTVIGGLFLMANLILFMVLYFKCYRNKKSGTNEAEAEKRDGDKRRMDEEAFLLNGCNIVNMMSKSSRSEDTYEAVRAETPGYNLSRQMSGSTIDAHTKVRDWIAQEIIYKYSPRFFRKSTPKPPEPILQREVDGMSSLDRSPTRPVSPSNPTEAPTKQVMKTSTITRPKIKPAKVSVAVDATPAGRGPSVLMQQPIELAKSLDYPHIKPSAEVPLRRSITLEDFTSKKLDQDDPKEMRKSTASIWIECPSTEPTIIKIDHKHSRSDPVQDLNYQKLKKLKTFDPNCDINVTSRDETRHTPLTPEESLQTIKRRNFPKVLPDHPGKEALMNKRRSMPAQGLFLPIPEVSSFSQPNSPPGNGKLPPPAPPPRMSTLTRQFSTQKSVFISEPKLAEEEPAEEAGIVFTSTRPQVRPELNTQPIYDSLKNVKGGTVKRADPKIVVKPTLSKKPSEEKVNKHIPRVVVPDNQPHLVKQTSKESPPEKTEGDESGMNSKPAKKSQIPTLVKTSNSSLNKESSSESTSPSEESDTGTVVKKVV